MNIFQKPKENKGITLESLQEQISTLAASQQQQTEFLKKLFDRHNEELEKERTTPPTGETENKDNTTPSPTPEAPKTEPESPIEQPSVTAVGRAIPEVELFEEPNMSPAEYIDAIYNDIKTDYEQNYGSVNPRKLSTNEMNIYMAKEAGIPSEVIAKDILDGTLY